MAYWNAYTPTNKVILTGGDQYEVGEDLKVETAASVKPGALVIKGSTDDQIVVSTTSSTPCGVVGYEKTGILERPADIDTEYTVNKRAFVHQGRVAVYGWLGTNCSADITKGMPLIPDTLGCVKNGTTAGIVIGYALESKSSSTTTIQRLKYMYTGA